MTKAVAKPVKVFLDSSVIMAALISSSGGSFRICRESSNGKLQAAINRYVHEEVIGVVSRKYPAKLEHLPVLLQWSRIAVLPNPRAKLVKQALQIIHPKDAAVLAGAMEAKAEFLISLDRKDFFTQTLRNAHLPLIISTPQEFFQEHW